MTGSTKTQLETSRFVHDSNSINTLRTSAKNDEEGAIEEVAKQFEAIFVKMLLKSMRQAQDALADKDSPFNSEQVKFYRDMHDQQMATNMSTKGGIGLADVIVQQMSQNRVERTEGMYRADGNLSSINRPHVMMRLNGEDKIFELDQAKHQAAVQKQAVFASPQEFVDTLYPQAIKAAEKLNIDPKALLAQAALETGWGQAVIHKSDGANSHNLFGIKADTRWQGDKAVVSTLEYNGSVAKQQQAAFRTYQDFGESLNDYVDFVKGNPRYQQALENTQQTELYFKELHQAGYATDPKYAEKVMSVYNGELLNGLLP